MAIDGPGENILKTALTCPVSEQREVREHTTLSIWGPCRAWGSERLMISGIKACGKVAVLTRRSVGIITEIKRW